MRLTELDPVWLMKDGVRVGFTFKCPTKLEWRQSCFAVAMPTKEQWTLFEREHGEHFNVQGCKPTCAWKIAGGIANATFETMTVTSSLDGSYGGMWHGHITNGQIVGGI
jgi:hypothetical protein